MSNASERSRFSFREKRRSLRFHGADDPYYADRYGVPVWAPAGIQSRAPIRETRELGPGQSPVERASLFRFNGKVPGTSLAVRPVRMHFSYDAEFGAYTPEAYERLLLEAMAGDATLFIRRDEVESVLRRRAELEAPLMKEE